MERVIDKYKQEEIDNYLFTNIKPIIDKGVDNSWEKLSKKDLAPFGKMYSFFSYLLMWILIIATAGFFALFTKYMPINIKRTVTKAKFINGFEADKAFINGSNAFDNFEIKKFRIATNAEVEFLSKNRIDRIPSDARIVNSSPAVEVKIKGKQNGIIMMGLFRWTRSNGKSTQTYYRPSAILHIDNPKSKNNFEFSLNYKNKIRKGEVLEDKDFNKQFQLDTKDKKGARLAFTPLVQEEFRLINDEVNIFKWKIEGKKNSYLIKWWPRSWQDCYPAATKIKFKSKESAKEKLFIETKNNLIDMFLISYVASLPLIL